MSADDAKRTVLSRSPEFPAPAAPALPQQKKRRIPKAIKEACDALVSGRAKTQAQAAEIAGYSREHFNRMLRSREDVVQYLLQRTQRQLAIGSAPAAARLTNLIWGAESEHVAFKASETVLAINGMAAKNNSQVSVNVDIRAGWVIDISPKDRASQPGDVIISGEQPAAEPKEHDG